MTIDGYDLQDGFTRNYHSFQLTGEHTNTTWTHRILGYFDRLGRMLGYEVQFEKERYDLTWWDYSINQEKGKIILHVEHENSTNKNKIIEETLEYKILDSEAKIALAICYPNNSQDFDEIKLWIKKNVKKRMKAEEVTIIVDGCCYGEEPYHFAVHMITKKKSELYLYDKITVNEYHCLEYKTEENYA